MSSEYFFKCNKCQEVGGEYTKQAWGWGNFYVIETFKFLAFHTENCGHEFIRVVYEDEVYEEIFNPKREIDFLNKTKDYFPSFETQFEGKNLFENEDIKNIWHEKKMQDAIRWDKFSGTDKNEIDPSNK